MQTSRLARAALAVLALAACSRKSASDSAEYRNGPVPVSSPSIGGEQGEGQAGKSTKQRDVDKPADNRKVIRTGRVDLVVAGYDEARGKLDALVQAAGGYIDSTQITRGQGSASTAQIVVRVPSANFGTFIPKLRELGDVRTESTAGQDVTDEYVDVAARLASSRTLEKRLLELAAAKNGTIDQVLAVERELARVRGEIEGFEARIKQWDGQIAMSTLAVEMSTKQPEIVAAASPSLGERVSHGFHASISALGDFGEWLAVNGIALVPWLVLVGPALFLGRKLAKRVKLPRAIAKEAQPPAA